MRSSVVFCNSVSADRIVMAVSRLLRAVAAFVILLSFAARLGFGATISDAVVRSSIVFCNSVSADRIVMAASRLLLALAACVMSFAARLHKSSWSGCMKAAK